MPQMMPINWMMSMLFFLFIYLMFNIMNYYIFINNKFYNNNNLMKNKMKNLNWKW
uniref:ATP synthase complex subunit 8 n=1 Tax=Euproctis cryptosticta TaxID=1706489 RepID=A0A3Q8CHH6_9NEOP|nr:ATP synthase F0 subunit 8 [Euproctis cryptosticta]